MPSPHPRIYFAISRIRSLWRTSCRQSSDVFCISCLLLLEFRPTILAVVRIMLDRAWERERLPAPLAFPLHDPRDVVFVLVLPPALFAVVRDMLPGWIVEDQLATSPAGFFQEFGFDLNRHRCHRF